MMTSGQLSALDNIFTKITKLKQQALSVLTLAIPTHR